ncbi:ISSfl4 ORF2 [Shigella flexneri 2a]|nr:ISSfl4 ORF2 [Shigella flexneri 2a]
MSRKTQRYSKEFKAEAVRTVLENQLSISEGASRLSPNVWPVTREGKVHLTPAQLSMLLEGIAWQHPKRTERPGIRI